jgi:hypothetical protein
LLGGVSDVIFITIITIGANGYKYDGDAILGLRNHFQHLGEALLTKLGVSRQEDEKKHAHTVARWHEAGE